MSARTARIPDRVLARLLQASTPPATHTAAELHCLKTLVHDGARHIAIGRGHHCTSIAAAAAFNAARTDLGGVVEHIQLAR